MILFLISLVGNDEHRDFLTDLYSRHKERMFYYAYSIIHDEFLAEDAVNQAFVGIVKNVEKIYTQDVSKVKPYVVVSVRNACLNLLKQQDRRQQEMLTDKMDEGIFVSADNMLADSDVGMLVDYLKQLPPKYQQALLLRYFFDYSYKEIGSVMGVSHKQVSVLLCRGKVMLKKIITEGGDGDE